MTFADYINKSAVFENGRSARRVKISRSRCGEIFISVDLHGMQKEEAAYFIQRLINSNPFAFSMEIIYGFNHGTVLRNMINQELVNMRIAKRYSDPRNPGSTYLAIV